MYIIVNPTNSFFTYMNLPDLVLLRMCGLTQLLRNPISSSHCWHQVGTEFFRGVSGGERKRTNIGMELIIEPQVLFLDEPTTGLDAYTAVSVVQLLKE